MNAEPLSFSDPEIFVTDTLWGYFERLRNEDPVHYCAESEFGPYWSVTRFDDIVHVEKNPEIYSSARSIFLSDPEPDFPLEGGFITMIILGPKPEMYAYYVGIIICLFLYHAAEHQVMHLPVPECQAYIGDA